MILLQEKESLELVTSAAAPLEYICEIEGAIYQGVVDQATTRQIAKGPGRLKTMALIAGAAQTVYLRKNVLGNRAYRLTPAFDLAAAGESAYYDDANGFYVLDSDGKRKITTA
jgi:hypothetical protein